MTYPGASDAPRRHAELVRLEAELRQTLIALVWAERAGEPWRAATLRREVGRLRRRVAQLRDRLGLPPAEEG